jgi:hypothetical protein
MSNINEWTTGEIIVATYLALELKQEPEFEWDEEVETCTFIFPESEALMELLGDYVRGKARVEPRAFHMKFVNLRRAMFKDRDEIRAG